MTAPTLRRVYRGVTVDAPPPRARGGYHVALDGRPLRTPTGLPLELPGRALAEAVAQEWDAQVEKIDFRTMPLTQLAFAAQDRVAPRRAAVVDELAGYGETDLLCHRAEAPGSLAERQRALWQPLLDWLEVRHGARLAPTEGVMPKRQDPHALASLRAAVATHDDFHLTALHCATTAAGSVVIGLALVGRRIDVDGAFAASQVDEDHLISLWGEEEGLNQRRAAVRADLEAARRLCALLAA